MYAQEELVPRTNGKTYASVKCYGCDKFGHYLSHCPEENGQQNMDIEEDHAKNDEDIKEDEGDQNLQIEDMLEDGDSLSNNDSYLVDFSDFEFLQEGTMTSKYTTASRVIKNNELKRKRASTQDTKSLLLDTGSTILCYNNPKMLINIRMREKPSNVVSNGGVMVISKEGDLPAFPQVYMNTIFMSDMRKKLRIMMDTSKQVAILVHLGNGKILRFLEVGAGLYIWKPEHNCNILNK